MLLFIVLLPLLTSVVVRTFAWIVILGREGVVNQLLLGSASSPTPLRLLRPSRPGDRAGAGADAADAAAADHRVMSRIDPNLRMPPRSLGAAHWRTFFRVMLPLSLPGVDRRLHC